MPAGSPYGHLHAAVPGLGHIVSGGDQQIVLPGGVHPNDGLIHGLRADRLLNAAGSAQPELEVVLPRPHGVRVPYDADGKGAPLHDATSHLGQTPL